MSIGSTKLDAMLEGERGNPEIIRRNGSALLSQLQENPGVMLRGHFIWGKHAHPRAGEELPETRLISRLPVSGGESGPQFSNHDQRQKNPGRPTHDVDSARFTPQKVTVRVSVERDVHLFPNLGIDLLKCANRSIEGRILPPSADQGI